MFNRMSKFHVYLLIHYGPIYGCMKRRQEQYDKPVFLARINFLMIEWKDKTISNMMLHTMKVSVPVSAARTPPDTGASNIAGVSQESTYGVH